MRHGFRPRLSSPADAPERCECCGKAAYRSDAEGVPLCHACVGEFTKHCRHGCDPDLVNTDGPPCCAQCGRHADTGCHCPECGVPLCDGCESYVYALHLGDEGALEDFAEAEVSL